MSLEEYWKIIGPQQNRTKCPLHRVRTVFDACKEIINNNKEGDFIELGVWKGGITSVMGKLCDIENKERKTFAFDSFEGMSKPNKDFDLSYKEDEKSSKKNLLCLAKPVQLKNFDINDFKKTCFDMMNVNNDTIIINKGWVDETLPKKINEINKISVLRIDLDWYEPSKIALEYLYPKVIKGGYIICDDYGYWKGARKAIDDYRDQNNIKSPMKQTLTDDFKIQPSIEKGTEHYWIKE